MKCLCITGATQLVLEPVAKLLSQAGMQPARHAKRDDTITLDYWHEQVLAQAQADQAEPNAEPGSGEQGLQPITAPGRLWEQLASDIFLANIKSGTWGWADSRSTWLLDFWLHFEPGLNFVLVCTSPAEMLANAMASVEPPEPVEALMDTWQAHHQQMLRFYHRNPGRCLLVDAAECAANPAALIERCNAQLKLQLKTVASPAAQTTGPGALALYLASQIAGHYSASMPCRAN